MTQNSTEIARDALRDIIIHLQSQIISNLKIQWQQDTDVDFAALLDVSDSSQDQAVLVLIQLHQRIIVSAPIETLKPPPLFSPDSLSSHIQESLVHPKSLASSPSPIISAGCFPAPPAYRPPISASQLLATDFVSEKKQHFSLVDKIGLSRRSKPERSTKRSLSGSIATSQPTSTVKNLTEKPNIIKHHQDRLKGVGETSDDLSRFEAMSAADSGLTAPEPETPEFNPWTSQRAPSPSQRSHISASSGSQFSHQRIQMAALGMMTSDASVSHMSVSPKDLLPSEANQYAGFCKGAWRLQIGDKKKAMDERQRPGGMYKANSYWQCAKCKFEGRMVMIDRKRKGFDTRVFMTEGIQFHWEFLFKSHVESKDGHPDPLRATFGCIFCCAEGRGTPTFGGADSFMTHLQEHRDRLPTGEVLYRMNCLVGQRAQQDDNFDVNLVSRIVEEI